MKRLVLAVLFAVGGCASYDPAGYDSGQAEVVQAIQQARSQEESDARQAEMREQFREIHEQSQSLMNDIMHR